MENKSSKKKTFILTIIVAGFLLIAALILFTVQNGRRITAQNREYLVDNAGQIAGSIDAALSDGYDNIKILSTLVSDSLTGPEFDIASMQDLIKNSVFDFMEYADTQGLDHNITGGISSAVDRQYYLDAKNGNTGMELIYVSRATRETLLMFYSPMYYEGEFAGSLVGVYQAAGKITNLLSNEYFGEKVMAYLATDEGRIIASSENYNPKNELYVWDLAESDGGLLNQLKTAVESGDDLTFSMGTNETGGCLMKLPENGWYLVQIFPQAASEQMIRNANKTGYVLVGFLMLLYLAILFVLIRFYRDQQRTVEEARNQAERANEAKTSFLFNMSHDIRTPMNAITGFTEKALRHQTEPEVLNASLEKVQSSSRYLLRIINDILDMAKIESGTMELNEKVYYSQDGADALTEMFAAEAARKDIKFHADKYDITDKYLWTDESRVSQIIANLVSNAIKYTNPGGEVWYSVKQVPCDRAGYARIVTTVRDNGKGMSKEFLDRIYDQFEREQSATKSGEQGTGLGMAIVKRLVDAFGGTIDIESEPGEGTCVTVVMEHRIPSAEEIEEFEKERRVKSDVSANKLIGKRILVVEDNELNREIAVDLLEEAGLIVETAEDGDIAVEMVQTIADHEEYDYYSAILMDVQMPRMDGYQATRAIRAIPGPEGVRIPIIAMTANAFEEDRRNALAAGMNDHIAKPVDAGKLWQTLSKYL